MRTYSSAWQITGDEKAGGGGEMGGNRQGGGGGIWKKIKMEDTGKDEADMNLGGPKADNRSSRKNSKQDLITEIQKYISRAEEMSSFKDSTEC